MSESGLADEEIRSEDADHEFERQKHPELRIDDEAIRSDAWSDGFESESKGRSRTYSELFEEEDIRKILREDEEFAHDL